VEFAVVVAANHRIAQGCHDNLIIGSMLLGGNRRRNYTRRGNTPNMTPLFTKKKKPYLQYLRFKRSLKQITELQGLYLGQ
jgi:hypothetical protein